MNHILPSFEPVRRARTFAALFGLLAAALPARASAQDAAPEPATAPPKPPPYSLPFQLRPVVAANVIRLDTTYAMYEVPVVKKSGSTITPILLGSYKVTENFAPLVRLGITSNSPPAPAKSATGFLNPVIGGIYSFKPTPELKIGFFLGLTIPIGSGGGDDPDPDTAAAMKAGPASRNAMDNAMFASNDFTVFPGAGVAYTAGGFTAQGEATLFQLTRVKGKKVQPDSSKTNLTAGIHLGYFFIPMLSAGVELRHQRWLKPPKLIDKDPSDTLKDTSTIAFGPRLHFEVGDKMWLRPGVALSLPLDKPMTDAHYTVIQIDVPFVF